MMGKRDSSGTDDGQVGDTFGVVVDTAASQTAGCSAVAVTACHFGPEGHQWSEVTTIADLTQRYQCRRCGAVGFVDRSERQA